MAVVVEAALFVVPLALEPDGLGGVTALVLGGGPVVGLGLPGGLAVGADQLQGGGKASVT
ncbi:hypothetical protein [Vreelandella stevensii]|uniref:hypothetical protein n=1 Tax=Vreelandella stevensii TaxID=502821 RepID=UPI003747F91A